MKKQIILATACLVASLAQAAPSLPDQLRLRVTVQPNADLGLSGNSMFNPRFFDGKIYANQINVYCFGRYSMGSDIPEMLVNNDGNSALEHRMVAPFRGDFSTNYLIASSSAAALSTTFTRYDYDGYNPVSIDSPDSMVVAGFDWVDNDTIIYSIYTSGNRKRLYLADVVAEPFAVTKNTSWNANGYITTSVSTRIRNVRKGDTYSGYAYYGDAGQNTNPNFYALNLATGAETLLGNAGTLTGTGSFGIWTVVERSGYLYVQTTDNGVLVYRMTDATTLGSLFTTYTKAQLDALTGGSTQYFGLDVTADGKNLLLGGLDGKVHQLSVRGVPCLPEQLQAKMTLQPGVDLSIERNSMFNPRFFDGKIYANQLNVPCFGRYPMDSTTPEMVVNNSLDTTMEHRMVAPFRGTFRSTYMIASSSAAASAPYITRYDFDGNNPVPLETPDTMIMDAFDWADNDTIIYAVYSSGNRKHLCLADVVADPFTVTKNTAWNADGYVTTSVSTRIRNVRKGDIYSGYAYYGDAGQNTNPNFYALNLATGVETLLGNAGTLTGSGSFGVWTVLERDGYLYVQTTDNGVQIYKMTDATTLGALYATCTKEQLDAITGGSTQYYGLDVTTDGQNWVLGGLDGKVYELQGHELQTPPSLAVSRSGANVVLSWPSSFSNMIVQSTASLSTSFTDLDPQPAVVVNGEQNTVTISNGESGTFFRLRK
jgi:hypothetical protein